MKNHKKFSIIFTAVMILSLLLAGSAVAKSDNKVEVCHQKGNGSYELIKINADALQSHLAHGDAAPGAAVPGQAGMVFGADCSLTSTGQNEPVQPETLPPATNNGKKADKVDICHKRGNETFILINVNRNALPAHLSHGDGLPNEWVPNQPGKKFSATCSMVEVPQKDLVETFPVYPVDPLNPLNAGKNPVSSMTLENGQRYEIKVSGTYKYILPYDYWADAEYFEDYLSPPDIANGEDLYSDKNRLDLSINSCDIDTDWGVYQENHKYTKEWTGDGTSLSFYICDSVYRDNSGSLTVEIWKINW
jgi:hypothetical protein